MHGSVLQFAYLVVQVVVFLSDIYPTVRTLDNPRDHKQNSNASIMISRRLSFDKVSNSCNNLSSYDEARC